ncbi:MAG: Paramecium bursaria Chlorella virus NYs1 [Bacteroidota bacterium]
MSVKLISISKPCIENMEKAEDLVAYCARVSNPSNQMNTQTAPKLLKYLIKHKHWSPFEMVSMTLEIKTSRAIAAQILRHRSFSFQEFSQRYSEAMKSTDVELREQGKTNRQVGDNVIDPVFMDDCYSNLTSKSSDVINKHFDCAFKLYNKLIDSGVARESARMILPLSTETTMYMAGTLRSWIHYIDLRAQKETQKEHRQIAEACKKIFCEQFPVLAEALKYDKSKTKSR